MKKDEDLTMLEMLFKYKDDEDKAVELLDNYPIKEIKEYYNKHTGSYYCGIIEKWSNIYNIPLTTTLEKLSEDLQDNVKIFHENILSTEFEKAQISEIALNIFLKILKQNREIFISWYKDNIEKYESAIPKAKFIKESTISRCDYYIKEALFIKFINDDLTLYNVDKENEND